MNAEEAEAELEALCERRGYDWSIKAEVSAECGWTVEVRVTPEPYRPDAPDRSYVTYSAAGGTVDAAIARAVGDMSTWLNDVTEQFGIRLATHRRPTS